MYFSHNPPCNQFYIRAHLCEALVTAPTGLVNKVERLVISYSTLCHSTLVILNQSLQIGLTECLNSIIKAVDVAKEFEWYNYNVLHFSILKFL